MSDYSLVEYPNRPARFGDHLALIQFPSGIKGFSAKVNSGHVKPKRTWRNLYGFIPSKILETPCAVCVPYGARLRLSRMSPQLQARYGVTPGEIVKLVELPTYTPAGDGHWDSLEFLDGRHILLQDLLEGLEVYVLSLGQNIPPAVEADLDYSGIIVPDAMKNNEAIVGSGFAGRKRHLINFFDGLD